MLQLILEVGLELVFRFMLGDTPTSSPKPARPLSRSYGRRPGRRK